MSLLGTGFVYTAQYVGPTGTVWEEVIGNRVPQEGLDYIARLVTGETSVVAPWYLGVFEKDYAPTNASSAGALATTIGETTAYDAATRPVFQSAYDGVSRVDNSLNRAEFVFSADKRIFGGFLVSTPAKHDTSGSLLSIARFSTPRDVEAGGTLRVMAGIQLVPSM